MNQDGVIIIEKRAAGARYTIIFEFIIRKQKSTGEKKKESGKKRAGEQ